MRGTCGDDGLPRTLKLEGSAIGTSEVDLPDYVLEELAQARDLATYEAVDLDQPNQVPRSDLIP